MAVTRQKDSLLAPFDPASAGGWHRRAAAHLLRRAGFEATAGEVDRAIGEGLEPTLDRLLTPQPESAEFTATERLLRQVAHDTGSIADLQAWWLYRMLYSANPLIEKLTLFWHDHFATSQAKVQSVDHMAAQNDLFRRHARGSFQDLLSGVARDVAMLVWLDGNANRKRHPNENFARELMELFTLGVGNYTEEDIVEAARAFTGWHVRRGAFWFNRLQHDTGTKTVFGRSGTFDGDAILGLCLKHEACPRFLAGKLLRYFVAPNAGQAAVEELASLIRRHDFEMTPVLRTLFGSRLFFAAEARHALIKSPVDLLVGAHRVLHSRADLQATARLSGQLGQDLFRPPTVAGWEGDRSWITSTTLIGRANFAADLTGRERYGVIADPTELIQPRDVGVVAIVRQLVELLLARDLDPAAEQTLAASFRTAGGSLDRRLRHVLFLIMTMPEYQLM